MTGAKLVSWRHGDRVIVVGLFIGDAAAEFTTGIERRMSVLAGSDAVDLASLIAQADKGACVGDEGMDANRVLMNLNNIGPGESR